MLKIHNTLLNSALLIDHCHFLIFFVLTLHEVDEEEVGDEVEAAKIDVDM